MLQGFDRARLFGDVIGEQKGRDVGKGTVYTQ